MKKVGKILGDILIVIVMIFSVLMTVLVITSTKSETGLPNIMGKAIFNVETDSMDGKDGFPEGSLIVVELLDEESANNLKVGDVITYWRTYDGSQYLDTHRIVDGTDYVTLKNEVVDGVWVHGGTHYYVTRGDNTPGIDCIQNEAQPEYASSSNIVAKWTGTAIPKLGFVMKFLRSQFGFLICVVVPVAIFFLYELYSFIATFMENKKQKNLAAVADAEEEIKKKAIAEFMAQQQAASGDEEKKAEPEKEQAPPEKEESKEKPADERPAEEKPAEKEEAPAPEAEKEEDSEESPVIDKDEEEEIKHKAVEEYLAKQAAEKAAAEEEIKRKAIEEYLASQNKEGENQ